MKKIVLIILLLSTMLSLYSINTSITLGYQERYTNDIIHAPIYISIDVSQDIGAFKLYGKYTNEMSKSADSWMFSPTQDYYMVGAEYDFDIFVLRAEHMCMHPVVSSGSWYGLQGGYTRFEVQI